MKKVFYPVVFLPEDGGYTVAAPDVDGCFSQGDSLEEAVFMIQDAIGLVLEQEIKTGKPFPPASKPNEIDISAVFGADYPPDTFVSLVEFDVEAYLKRNNTQAVKKTLTIPAWLNTLAEENDVNFSQLLQKALKQELHLL